MRFQPIIPRLQQLYTSLRTTPHLTTNDTLGSDDGYIRSVIDLELWKNVMVINSTFKGLRLAVVSDGFNPSSLRSSSYSITPVVVIVYNLPPHLTTKKEFIFLSLIIPGKFQVKNMDVYLRPLIIELQLLWSLGVPAHDISKPNGQQDFILRAIVLWTITDYPGATSISGT